MDWKELFKYDPTSPTYLINLTNRSPRAKEGMPAGCVGTKETKVNIGGKFYRNARIVWELHHGEIEDGKFIGFKDGDCFNCSIENLFLQTRRERGVRGNHKVSSSTGSRGVHFRNGKFQVYAKIMGKLSYLGTCDDLKAAQTLRKAALRFVDRRLDE